MAHLLGLERWSCNSSGLKEIIPHSEAKLQAVFHPLDVSPWPTSEVELQEVTNWEVELQVTCLTTNAF